MQILFEKFLHSGMNDQKNLTRLVRAMIWVGSQSAPAWRTGRQLGFAFHRWLMHALSGVPTQVGTNIAQWAKAAGGLAPLSFISAACTAFSVMRIIQPRNVMNDFL